MSPLSDDGRASVAGRSAWERLSAQGPDVLPALLEAMNGKDTVAANWLRTAFDRIVDRSLAKGGKDLPLDGLLAFAGDTSRSGRARRLALDLIEKLKPGTSLKLYRGGLEDPEFRYEAVALQLDIARKLLKEGQKDKALHAFRQALASSRDVQQGRDAAAGLLDLGETVSVAQHLGFLGDWYLIGPFDAMGQKGFRTEYAPEKRVDLKEELEGQGGKKLRWVRYHAEETSPRSGARHQVLINLREKEALGDADDAVAFAYTEFTVDKAQEVEFRAADDNLTVFVNGRREFGFEEYRNGVRLDRHRFKAKLQPGKNTVLVKVCQTPAPNPEPNWEFLLRVVDDTGKGIAIKNTLPPTKK